jgi:hypothetical protein
MKEGQAGACKINIIENRYDTGSLLQPGLHFTMIWKVLKLYLTQALSKCEEYLCRNFGKQPREFHNESYLRFWCFHQRNVPSPWNVTKQIIMVKDLEFGFIWHEVVDG